MADVQGTEIEITFLTEESKKYFAEALHKSLVGISDYKASRILINIEEKLKVFIIIDDDLDDAKCDVNFSKDNFSICVQRNKTKEITIAYGANFANVKLNRFSHYYDHCDEEENQ